MKRISESGLLELCGCLLCGAKLKSENDNLVCVGCGERYLVLNKKPVLMSPNNKVFPADKVSSNLSTIVRRSRLARLKSFVPSRSINLSRERKFQEIGSEFASRPLCVLVLGCGNQLLQIEEAFQDSNHVFVFCDVSVDSDADVLCDAHELPFVDQCFDGVISTAVMEHVMQPDVAVAEVLRVLKREGFIYSEIPFLQAVHEGAHDITRYTMTGHRRLLSHFEEKDAGMVAGPGTALLWALTDISRAVFPPGRIASAAVLATRLIFFWLKHIDRLLVNSTRALDYSSCTYFYGKKAEEASSSAEILARYRR